MGLFDQLLNKAGKMISNDLTHKAKNAATDAAKASVNNAVSQAAKKKQTYTFNALPKNVEELKALPEASLKDPFAVAALTVLALCQYEADKEACFAMLDFLKGPRPLTPSEKSFITDRLTGKIYVARSYLAGTNPQNNYTPTTPYQITVADNPYSYDNAGYTNLWLTSSGADSPRNVMLRQKESTGEWFLWENFLLPDIRVPANQNPWA